MSVLSRPTPKGSVCHDSLREELGCRQGHRAILPFKSAGWFSKDLHRVEGFLIDKLFHSGRASMTSEVLARISLQSNLFKPRERMFRGDMSSEHWWDVNDSAKYVLDGNVIEEVGVSYNGVNCDNTSMENITISLNTNTTTIEEEAIGKEDGCGNKRLNTSIDEPASLPVKTLPSSLIKKNLNFLYGKWTEFIRCTDVISYEEYMRKNVHKFRREGDSKGKSTTPNESPLHNPKTVLSKLNSLKVSPFKSNSQAETCFGIRTLKETVKSFPPHEADEKVERRVLILGNLDIGRKVNIDSQTDDDSLGVDFVQQKQNGFCTHCGTGDEGFEQAVIHITAITGNTLQIVGDIVGFLSGIGEMFLDSGSDDGCSVPDPSDGDVPTCDSTYSIDIPNSTTLWEADPRPENSAEGSDDGCSVPDPSDGDVPTCDSTYSIDIPNSTTLWEADPRPENSAEYYQFTQFAMSLNEMEEGMKTKLCPTDCRLRPDIRKLEEGDIDGAAAENNSS
uniref:Uncharacterized protein n=1 Tax=Timema shepardi TaxID=629360 RepID=A0A7R9B2Q0_TIMSH|nr:unnamed protein product [Timema shepardi]